MRITTRRRSSCGARFGSAYTGWPWEDWWPAGAWVSPRLEVGKAGLPLAITRRVLVLENPPPLTGVKTALGMLSDRRCHHRGRTPERLLRYLALAMGAYPFVLMSSLLAVTGERPDLAPTGWALTFVGVAVALSTGGEELARSSRLATHGRSQPRGSAPISA